MSGTSTGSAAGPGIVESAGERRFLGAVWLIAGAASVIGAFLAQPIADWGGFGWVLGGLMVLMALVGAWMLITGQGHILSDRYSLQTQSTIAIIGLIVVTVVIIGNIHLDEARWTAADVLTLGVWVAVGSMFIVSLRAVARAASRRNAG